MHYNLICSIQGWLHGCQCHPQCHSTNIQQLLLSNNFYQLPYEIHIKYTWLGGQKKRPELFWMKRERREKGKDRVELYPHSPPSLSLLPSFVFWYTCAPGALANEDTINFIGLTAVNFVYTKAYSLLGNHPMQGLFPSSTSTSFQHLWFQIAIFLKRQSLLSWWCGYDCTSPCIHMWVLIISFATITSTVHDWYKLIGPIWIFCHTAPLVKNST